MLEKRLGKLLRDRRFTIAVAESLTGGLFSKRITDIPGSSDYFLGGIVAYSYFAKGKVLNVPENTLRNKGLVSKETASYIAKNVSLLFNSDIGVGVTGVAGPLSQEDKPVGLVYIAVFYNGNTSVIEKHFTGNREKICTEAVDAAMELIIKKIGG